MFDTFWANLCEKYGADPEIDRNLALRVMAKNGITIEELREVTRIFQIDNEEKVRQKHAEAEAKKDL